jgi:UDP-glucose 4-epimerase
VEILVTGGLGYIGSHVATLLIEAGMEVLIIDNLANTRIEVLDGIESITGKRPYFKEMDVCDSEGLSQLVAEHPNLKGVIHFAAHKSVNESIAQPIEYYENNLGGLNQLLKISTQQSIPFIFSSSCTVYGQAEKMPIREDAPLKKATSPYGNTKRIGEEIIQDCCKAFENFNAVLLRYFNPIGAHESAKIGEYPRGVPQNLVPFLTQTVIGKYSKLRVFGSDYPTKDGTCIRDYIHVMDLAQAHIASLNYLLNKQNTENCEVFNVGTGKGVSVLELIYLFEKATGEKVPYVLSNPREGDTIEAYADAAKIKEKMGWQTKYSIEEALQSAWKWEVKLKG